VLVGSGLVYTLLGIALLASGALALRAHGRDRVAS
jgi:hypothetical protein